ncbi:MAG TPA: hypothetical protein VJT73_12685, partial [Polyangiaceae bacterium]|nr:hypothetical protein [Polyangiaceae bacterium]
VLLVAPDRLGVLHDVTASLGLARARGFAPDALVLSTPGEPDASTGSNAAELQRLRIAEPLAIFPHTSPLDATSLQAASTLVDRFLSQAPRQLRACR